MTSSSPFHDTDETRTALMQATYDALCKHGYAGLTIQRISDEFPKSKSLIQRGKSVRINATVTAH